MEDRIDPTQEDLENPLFNAIFDVIKKWDINIGDGTRGGTGNDAKELLDKIQQTNKRAVDCVNALSCIPDEWLPDVRKAVIVAKLYAMLSAWYDDAEMDMVFTLRSGIRFEQHYGQLPDPKKLIEMAQKLRAIEVDFGPELNTLIGAME